MGKRGCTSGVLDVLQSRLADTHGDGLIDLVVGTPAGRSPVAVVPPLPVFEHDPEVLDVLLHVQRLRRYSGAAIRNKTLWRTAERRWPRYIVKKTERRTIMG